MNKIVHEYYGPETGISEYLTHDKKYDIIKYLEELDTRFFRTEITAGQELSKDLLSLANKFEVLPVISYNDLFINAKNNSHKNFLDSLELTLQLLPDRIKYVELKLNYDGSDLRNLFTARPEEIFSFISKTAAAINAAGKKTVLSSELLSEPFFVELLSSNDVFTDVYAVSAIQKINYDEDYIKRTLNSYAGIQQIFTKYRVNAEIWCTEAGHSSGNQDEFKQLTIMSLLLHIPFKRIYWNSLLDKKITNGSNTHTNSGLIDSSNRQKLLFRIWRNEGIEGVAEYKKILNPEKLQKIIYNGSKPDLIIGGSGFIGTNLADRLLSSGRKVRIYDNLSRPGVEQNLNWLYSKYGDQIEVEIGDVREKNKLKSAVKDTARAFHFAAQVAVTTSLENPELDFEVNLRGTFNLLEAIRSLSNPLPLIFTSTNKVYGGLESLRFTKDGRRYIPEIESKGINEGCSLDFHSPYGCSKGAADQYILDYARSYKLPTVVFRMSCIYGPHQFGTEDQGWVAHFILRAIKNEKIIIYGDGKQVRDILYVDDLVDAFLAAQNNMTRLAGQVFNIGGGINRTISLIELLYKISSLSGIKPKITFSGWRTGDQKYYVSDVTKFNRATGWSAQTSVDTGLKNLYEWLLNNYKNNESEKNLIKSGNIKSRIVA